MTKPRKIIKDTGTMLAMEFGVNFSDAIISILLAWYLGPAGLGLMAFAMSFASLYAVLPGFGMGAWITRDLAREPDKMSLFLSNGLIVKLFLSLSTLALILGSSLVLHHDPHRTLLVMFAALLMIFETNTNFVLSVFQGYQKMTVVAVVNLLQRAVWVISALLVIFFHGGIAQLLGVRALIYGIGFCISIVLIESRLEKIRWTFDVAFIKRMMKASMPFALFRIFGSVYTDLDTVMLSSMRGDVMTGWYAAGYKFLRVFSFIPGGVFQAILPAFTKLSRESRENMLRTLERSIKFLLIFVLPICAGTTVLANRFTLMIYGPKFSGSGGALRILIWSLLFTFLNSALNASIAAVDQEKRGSGILFLGLLFSALSNLIVIPKWGYLGAAMTTILSEAVVFSLQARLVAKKIPGLRIWRYAGKPFLATLVMLAAAWLLQNQSLFLSVPVSGAVYLAALVSFKAIDQDEWDLMRKIFVDRFKKRNSGGPKPPPTPGSDPELISPI